jgi:guanosine-3',5'-bis(diphosphate) 3'-pyrophosphohydrolase
MGFADLDGLLAAIGEHQITAVAVVNRLMRDRAGDDDADDESVVVARSRGGRRGTDAVGVHVEGLDDVLVRLSRCCTPVPGDEIIGFVTRGRGVSVHRSDCANASALAAEQGGRVLEVDWDVTPNATYRAGVEVVALDRSKLLRDVANALSDHHVNIVACSTHTGNDRVAKMRFEFELGDHRSLDAVLRTIKGIDGVYDAYRLVPGHTG